MKKVFIPTLVILALFSVYSWATNYEWVMQGTQNNKIGFGSVITAESEGSICISSCDGMAKVDADNACQIGTGTTENPTHTAQSLGGDNSFKFRDTVILEDTGVLGVRAYGNMLLNYAMWKEEFNEAGYVAGAAATTNVAGALIPGTKFDEVAYRAPWLVTVVDGGGDDAETIRIDDNVNSMLEIVSNNASNDTVQVQLNGEPFQLTNGKEMWFNSRFAVTQVTNANFAIGLTLRASTDTIGTAPADGVYFQMDHDGNLDYHVIQNATDTTGDTGVDLTDAALHSAGFYYNGASNIAVIVDSITVTNIIDDGATILIPDDEELTSFIAIETFRDTAQTVQVDYIGVINTR